MLLMQDSSSNGTWINGIRMVWEASTARMSGGPRACGRFWVNRTFGLPSRVGVGLQPFWKDSNLGSSGCDEVLLCSNESG